MIAVKLRNYNECVQLYKFLEDSNYTGYQHSILHDIVISPSYFSQFGHDMLELDMKSKRYIGFTYRQNISPDAIVSLQDLIQKDGRIIL